MPEVAPGQPGVPRAASSGGVDAESSVGNETVAVVPAPTTLATSSVPPIASVRRRASTRPSPAPPSRPASASSRSNGTKRRSISSAGIPGPVVDDAQRARRPVRRRRHSYPLVRIGESDGVGQQVDDDLGQPSSVGAHLGTAQVGVDRKVLSLGERAQEFHHLGNHIIDVDRGQIEGQGAGLDTSQIEHVVDE